jgi:hypothetical protein
MREEQALEFARALSTGLGEIGDVQALHMIPTDCTLYLTMQPQILRALEQLGELVLYVCNLGNFSLRS